MKINNKTEICISIAQHPSNFGVTVHNTAYEKMGLNFIYKPFKITDLRGAIRAIRVLGIRGCSVTMPFKEKVIKYLDKLDVTASGVGAVNTIVNNKGKLIGYNTDVYGAFRVLQELRIPTSNRILVLGGGGVAKAISYALYKLNFHNVFMSNRTIRKVKTIAEKFGYEVLPWGRRNDLAADMLINATSIGMVSQENMMPVSNSALRKYHMVMDVVVTPIHSRLINKAKMLRKKVIPGYKMSLYQAAAQFELYSRKKAPLAIMQKAILSML